MKLSTYYISIETSQRAENEYNVKFYIKYKNHNEISFKSLNAKLEIIYKN